MPEPNKKQPKGAPELPDDAKKILDDQGDISRQKHAGQENLPEVMEPGIAEQEAELGDENQDESSEDQPAETGKKHRIRKFFAAFWRHKKWTLPLTLLAVVGALLAVPATRYPLLSPVVSSTYSVEITDSKSGAPVSGATVVIEGKSALTDAEGRAKIKAHVGKQDMTVSKKYYTTASSQILVGLKSQNPAVHIKLAATGRQVPLKVVDKLSGKAVKNAEIKVLDTSAKTDETGQAIIVLPTKNPTEKATVTASGYNQASAQVHITNKIVAENTISLVSAGRVYFLSNKSGDVDVVSTNFDGTSRATVAAGMGNEDSSTRLFVSPSRKYLALYAKRDDSKTAKLYVIDTSSNNVAPMDGALAGFGAIGWAGDNFVYTAESLTAQQWQPHQAALKSFDAASSKVTTLAQTNARGKSESYAYQLFSFVKILNDQVVYGLAWDTMGYYDAAGADLSKQSNVIASVSADGSSKRTLKSLKLTNRDLYTYLSAVQPSPQVLYIRHSTSSAGVFYVYQDGNVTQTNSVNEDTFYKERPTYLVSPSGQRAFWTENRDGKAVVFVGDANGENGKQVATLDNFTAYGWNTDGYLLVSKNNSQLYTLPADGLSKGRQPMKVSDYYTVSMRGF